ncbi:DUF2490 domain-containing protein [Aureibacter tunicatorum]|uniref:DUF2490 domain-containing protein n=1 Tax=Aureibacter tunicatorum TaxID=866807 RepID=A0AAE4BVC9_9BACT|nr:DUF2490 domain-containing protein [Aureibacter tunicatorum]MDR6241767.1 hypothetical protein [Aureibacter tunicatorum]
MQWLKIKIKLSFRFYLAFLSVVFIHQNGVSQIKNQYRLYYFGDFPAQKKSSFSFGSGVHSMPSDQWLRMEMRTMHEFSLTSNLKFGLGQRSNFSRQEGGFKRYELRPFQNLTYTQNLGDGWKFIHRLMMEERAFIDKGEENTLHGRLRYRLDANISLSSMKKFYLRPMSEMFFTFADNRCHYWSQWKNTLAFGTSLCDNIMLECRYEYMLNSDESLVALDQPLQGFRLQLVQRF